MDKSDFSDMMRAKMSRSKVKRLDREAQLSLERDLLRAYSKEAKGRPRTAEEWKEYNDRMARIVEERNGHRKRT